MVAVLRFFGNVVFGFLVVFLFMSRNLNTGRDAKREGKNRTIEQKGRGSPATLQAQTEGAEQAYSYV